MTQLIRCIAAAINAAVPYLLVGSLGGKSFFSYFCRNFNVVEFQ